MTDTFMKNGLHYFSTDETQLYLEEEDYVEYYARDIHKLVVFKVIGANHEADKGNVKYTGLLISGNWHEPIWHFRGLACNTRKLDPEMAKLLYG